MNSKEKEQVTRICIRIPESTLKVLDRAAAMNGRTRSDMCREMLDRGLAAAGYLYGEEDMAELLHKAAADAIRPQADRMASISAKAAQIAAASFFLSAWLGHNLLPESLRVEFDEVSENARRLGAQYLKVGKERSLDGFISVALRQMGGDLD